MSVVANESVTLECQSQAVPPPVLSWRKDGRPLEPRPGVHLSADKALLEVGGLLGCRRACGGPDKGSLAPYDPGPGVHPPDLVRSRCRASHSPHKAEPFSCHLFSFLVQRPPGLWALEPFIGPLAQRGKGGLESGTLGQPGVAFQPHCLLAVPPWATS